MPTAQPGTALQSAHALLTLIETARELRVSKSTVLRLVGGDVPNRPKLPCVRMGRRLLFRRESIARYIVQAEESAG